MDKDIYLLIAKHLSGRSTAEEDFLLNDWLLQSEDNRAYFEEVKYLWNDTSFSDQFSNKEAVFDKILNNIQDDEREVYPPRKSFGHRYNRITAVAASLLLLISIGYSFFLYRSQSGSDLRPSGVKWIKKENPAGQKSKIYLSDGTIAYLNAESSLKYISEFSDSARDIYLEGEAYFEVKKDLSRPFRVHGKDFDVTALGTKFNVNSFHNEKSSTISLVEGKVSVSSSRHFEVLNPGESLLIRKEKNEVMKLESIPEELVAWKDGVLIFSGDNLGEVIRKLERWYGVNITISGKPDQNMVYNGVFRNEYLSNVLESMRYGREFDVTIDGKNVSLNF